MKTPTLDQLLAAAIPAPPARRIAALRLLEGQDPEPKASTVSPERTGPQTAFTLAGAARLAGFSTMTLRRAIKAGDLHVVRPTGNRPRILAGELKRWIEAAQ